MLCIPGLPWRIFIGTYTPCNPTNLFLFSNPITQTLFSLQVYLESCVSNKLVSCVVGLLLSCLSRDLGQNNRSLYKLLLEIDLGWPTGFALRAYCFTGMNPCPVIELMDTCLDYHVGDGFFVGFGVSCIRCPSLDLEGETGTGDVFNADCN